VPDRIVIDKSGANLAGLQAVNAILKFTGNGRTIEVRRVKYLNNILEQDHRFIKQRGIAKLFSAVRMQPAPSQSCGHLESIVGP
jgi:transposase-like protein